METVIKDFIVPRHQALSNNIVALQTASHEFCNTASDAPRKITIEHVQNTWQHAMTAWTMLAPINFGPIDEENLHWRFQFWPDKINLVHRKLQSRVKGTNTQNSDSELANASVAIQGLSTIEYLLFDPAIGGATRYQQKPHLCVILKGTVNNLLTNARFLETAWATEYPRRWLADEKAALNPDYLKFNVETVFSGIVMTLDFIAEKKLAAPLGLKESLKPNPWLLESWRSKSSITQIKTGIETTHQLYSMPFGLHWYLQQVSPQGLALNKKIEQHYKTLQNAVNAIDANAFDLIQRNQTDALQQVHQQLRALHSLLQNDYAKAANIQFRFNAHDGD